MPYYPRDAWALDLTGVPQWTQLLSSAPFNGYLSAVYDSRRDRALVFGGSVCTYRCDHYGYCETSYSGAVHELRLSPTPSWATLIPAGPLPSARNAHSAIYDPLRDRMVVFGGVDTCVVGGNCWNNELWALALDPSPAWTPLAPDGNGPLPSAGHVAIYDPRRDAMWLYLLAGESSTWRLDWGTVTPVLASLVRIEAESDRVRVEWQLGVPGTTRVTVYRNADGSTWEEASSVEVGGSGRVQYEDRAVEPGRRYGYRLGLPMPDGQATVGEAWVETPWTMLFLLDGAKPNPTTRDLAVSFQIPSPEPVVVTVIDAAGRLVARRELSGLVPGRHIVPLLGEKKLPPGLYILRLQQGHRAATAKAVVLN